MRAFQTVKVNAGKDGQWSASQRVTAWYTTHTLGAECVPIYTIPGRPHIQCSCLGQHCRIYAVSILDKICNRSMKSSSLRVRHLPFASLTNLPLPGFPNFQNDVRWRTKECKLCLSLLQSRAKQKLSFHRFQDPNTWFKRTLFIGTKPNLNFGVILFVKLQNDT